MIMMDFAKALFKASVDEAVITPDNLLSVRLRCRQVASAPLETSTILQVDGGVGHSMV